MCLIRPIKKEKCIRKEKCIKLTQALIVTKTGLFDLLILFTLGGHMAPLVKIAPGQKIGTPRLPYVTSIGTWLGLFWFECSLDLPEIP